MYWLQLFGFGKVPVKPLGHDPEGGIVGGRVPGGGIIGGRVLAGGRIGGRAVGKLPSGHRWATRCAVSQKTSTWCTSCPSGHKRAKSTPPIHL